MSIEESTAKKPEDIPNQGNRNLQKFCPCCGNALSADAAFCSKCGAKQPDGDEGGNIFSKVWNSGWFTRLTGNIVLAVRNIVLDIKSLLNGEKRMRRKAWTKPV